MYQKSATCKGTTELQEVMSRCYSQQPDDVDVVVDRRSLPLHETYPELESGDTRKREISRKHGAAFIGTGKVRTECRTSNRSQT